MNEADSTAKTSTNAMSRAYCPTNKSNLPKKIMLEPITKVKFVIFQKEIIALFPDDVTGNLINSYQHIGQHGSASKSLLRCKRATKYQDLLQELTDIGYNLEII